MTTIRTFDQLAVGQRASRTHTVTREAIAEFARLSGDANPVHLDDSYAAGTPFKGVIAHGALSNAFISSVLGMDLPGPGAIYMSQRLDFRAPVRPGDQVVAEVEVIDLNPERAHARLATRCRVGETVVAEGEAVLKVPRPK